MNSQRACWIAMVAGGLILGWSMDGVPVSHVCGIVLAGAIMSGAGKRLRELGYKSWGERWRDRRSASRASVA